MKPRWIALLRAVNVGGTGKLPMSDLRALAIQQGLQIPQTYLASGNLIFDSVLPAPEIAARLSAGLPQHMGVSPGVVLRQGLAVAALLKDLPFADAPGNQVGIVFTDVPATQTDLAAKGQTTEGIALHAGHIVIHYPNGMGQSRLRLAAFDHGTQRNRNTVAALARMVE